MPSSQKKKMPIETLKKSEKEKTDSKLKISEKTAKENHNTMNATLVHSGSNRGK